MDIKFIFWCVGTAFGITFMIFVGIPIVLIGMGLI